MTKHFILKETIDKEIVEKFIALVEGAADGDDIKIYLTSFGGATAGTFILTNIIEDTHHLNFTIYAIENVFSAAFDFFFNANCQKVVAPGCIGMIHLAGSEMRILDNGKPMYDGDKMTVKAGKQRTEDLLVLAEELGFSKAQVKKILKGDDVYFDYYQMCEMLDHQGRHQHYNIERIKQSLIEQEKREKSNLNGTATTFTKGDTR